MIRQRDAAARAELMDQRAEMCDTALGRRVDTGGDRFAMTVEDVQHTSRVDAGVHLRRTLLALLEAPPPKGSFARVERSVPVGQLGGFGVDVDVTAWPDGHNDATMRIERLPVRSIPLERRDVSQADPVGLIARLENRLHKLEDSADSYRTEALGSRREGVEIAARIGRLGPAQATRWGHFGSSLPRRFPRNPPTPAAFGSWPSPTF